MSVEFVANELEVIYGQDRSRWITILEQLCELDEVVPQLIKDADKQYWVVSSLKKFLDLALKNDQNISLNKKIKGDYIETDLLVKINRLVPKKYLDFYNIQYVLLGSLYVDFPTIVLGENLSSCLDTGLDDRCLNGLVPDSYHLGTRCLVDDLYFVALGKNEICPLFVNKSADWSYFELW